MTPSSKLAKILYKECALVGEPLEWSDYVAYARDHKCLIECIEWDRYERIIGLALGGHPTNSTLDAFDNVFCPRELGRFAHRLYFAVLYRCYEPGFGGV